MASSSRRPLVSILGDSISTFEGCNPEGFDVFYEGERRAATGVERRSDTWWQLVIDALGGDLLANASFSGSMVEGAGFPAGSSDERISALACDGAVPDIVLVFIGINDYGWGGACNQAAGKGRAVPAAAAPCDSRTVDYAETRAAQRFAHAYKAMLSKMCAAYPDAVICCCTLCPGRLAEAKRPTFIRRLRGVDVEAYNDAIRVQAAAHACMLVDFAACGFDYEAVDGTHPTARGMRQLAALALSAMSEQGIACVRGDAVSLEEAFADVDMRSDDSCRRPDCIGCPHARSTGNAWSLVCERELGS